MGIADLIKLGAHGFKPSEIKEFKEKGISSEEVIRLSENGYTAADINELITLSGEGVSVQPGNEGAQNPPGPAEEPGNEGAEDKPDYKAQAEAAAREAEELKKKLAEAQARNSARDLSGGAPVKTAREQVQEAFRQIY